MTDYPNSTQENDALRNALRRAQQQHNGKIPRADLSDQPEPETPRPTDNDDTKSLERRHREDSHSSDRRPARLGETVQRDTRQILRRVQKHLISAHISLGAVHQVVDLTEVLYHPENHLASLNYVTPRKKTAWISAEQVQHGLDYLQERGRTPRLRYIEGLYPPLFSRNLHKLDLVVESEIPLMVHIGEGAASTPPPVMGLPTGGEARVEVVRDVRGMEVWWYVWRNAHYDVFTLGVEPLFVGRDIAAMTLGNQIDVIAYQGSFPFGVARITLHDKTAHIAGVAMFRELNSPEALHLILSHALAQAHARGAEVVFMPGETDIDRKTGRALGFADFGSVVCYIAKSGLSAAHGDNYDNLEQPILDFRPNTSNAD